METNSDSSISIADCHNTSSEVELMETTSPPPILSKTLRHNTSSEVELMETATFGRGRKCRTRSQHFFGSGINGNRLKAASIAACLVSQHFFGSGINGNHGFPSESKPTTSGHNTSSEVELMETSFQNQLIFIIGSQHFFGSGINGNPLKLKHLPSHLKSQHFFGSGINGNRLGLGLQRTTHHVTTLLRKWN